MDSPEVQGIEVPPDPAAKPAKPKNGDPLGFFGTPTMSGDFDRVVDKVFEIDVLPTYERIECELVIGEDRSDYATLRRKLDQAEDLARLAHKLYVNARVEQERYELDMRPIRAAMSERANRELQREKADGQRSKAITKDDIENYIATNFADEYRAQELKMLKLRKMTEHLEQLASIWRGRPGRIEALLNTLRR